MRAAEPAGLLHELGLLHDAGLMHESASAGLPHEPTKTELLHEPVSYKPSECSNTERGAALAPFTYLSATYIYIYIYMPS